MYIQFSINDLTKWQCTPALSPSDAEREKTPADGHPLPTDGRGAGGEGTGNYERFNIEATGEGLSCFPDEYYHTWPEPLTAEEIASGQYLKSLTPDEELAVFLSARGNCLEANGRYAEARTAYAEAHRLAPKTTLYRGLLDRVTAKESANTGITKNP